METTKNELDIYYSVVEFYISREEIEIEIENIIEKIHLVGNYFPVVRLFC